MAIAARVDRNKYDVFRWRYELSLPKKLALAVGIACLTGLIAQIRIVIPWSPVPVTGQTFAVLLAGVILGRWWGGISLTMYAGLGIAGVPWFTGWGGGLSHLAGPTGGYIIGFILAALFLGHFTDKYIRSRSFLSMLGLMLFANFILIYVPGVLQLGLWINLVKGEPIAFTNLLMMGVIPFIAGDITKAILAAAIARGVTPKSAYNGEVDKDKWASWRLP
ncbi:MAG: biotin transporter BioY [Dehalococcoidales bacterium]|nr:biotin transporter BioY [Dehalococcoidales bacterium]MDP6448649.1 biotin transporter BioY [Dehalococcoidales bacterium]MDP6576880.1 biotin transporter BioY [Dehalococcoidales bacterium]MDP6824848.1 biotin transporter BioY [Dehalococcoidales bacterium]